MREYTTSIEVRFADLDLYGHVNGVAYFTFMETARVKLFSAPFRELTRQGVFLVVARAECSYAQPILPGDSVLVTISVSRIGGSSFELSYRLHDGAGKEYAVASTTMVCFDNTAKRPVPIPEQLSQLLHDEDSV